MWCVRIYLLSARHSKHDIEQDQPIMAKHAASSCSVTPILIRAMTNLRTRIDYSNSGHLIIQCYHCQLPTPSQRCAGVFVLTPTTDAVITVIMTRYIKRASSSATSFASDAHQRQGRSKVFCYINGGMILYTKLYHVHFIRFFGPNLLPQCLVYKRQI